MRKAWTSLLILTVTALLGAGTAEARHPGHPPQTDDAVQHGDPRTFDYYLLTLSWSPTFCLTHKNDTRQCGNKGFGFVLHGLWPQYRAGGYPQNCSSDTQLSPGARDFGNTVFPNPNLVTHEWATHGTCSGLDALEYFKAADQARTSVVVPQSLESPTTTFSTTADDIVSQFMTANPNFPDHSVVVACSGPQFSEVRICMDRNLNPTSCGGDMKSNCSSRGVRVPAVH
jgi:ribonuclease T2